MGHCHFFLFLGYSRSEMSHADGWKIGNVLYHVKHKIPNYFELIAGMITIVPSNIPSFSVLITEGAVCKIYRDLLAEMEYRNI